MILKEGDSGTYVVALQKVLGVTADGQFGPLTKSAVIGYQQAHGLVADGVVGPLTQASLQSGAGPASPPPVIVPHGGPIQGVDDYHLDNVTDWNAVHAAGKMFAMHKASQGLSADPLYFSRHMGSKAAGLISGPYHFMNFNSDGASQAEYYWSHIKSSYTPEDLMPMLDWEYSGDQEPSMSDVRLAQAFTRQLLQLCGRRQLLLYIGWSHYQTVIDLGFKGWLEDNFILEIAQYGVSKPHGNYPWKFWQYSESGSVPGFHNPVDLDLFQGSIDDLRELIKGGI